MKKKSISFALAAVISSMVTASSAIGQSTNDVLSGIAGAQCPSEWFTALPPNPDWGLPSLADMLPAEYYDSELVGFFFPVPAEAVQRVVPDGLTPFEAVEGLGVVGVAFFNHRQNAYVAPYKELVLSVLVNDPSMFAGFTPQFMLPVVVTTEDSQWGGIQGYGINKILGNVHCTDVPPKGFKCMASADDQLIVKVEWNPSDALPTVLPPYLSMSVKGQYLVRAPFIINHGDVWADATPGAATVVTGEHPVGQLLKLLGMGQFPSALHSYGSHLSATLYEPLCTWIP